MQTKRNQPAQSPYSRSRRVLLRYVLSYALILLIPCLLFSSVYEQYYEKAYTEKILAQHQIRLDRVYADFVALEENMQSIAVSLPVWDELKRASAMDAPTYAKLKKTLLVFSITNPAFEYLDYYTLTAPQFVFTSEGTYTPEYYSLYLLDGEWVQVDRRLSAIREGTWILPDEVQWNTFSGRKVRLEYIIPATSDKNSHVIFTINPQSLEGFVGILQDRPLWSWRATSKFILSIHVTLLFEPTMRRIPCRRTGLCCKVWAPRMAYGWRSVLIRAFCRWTCPVFREPS